MMEIEDPRKPRALNPAKEGEILARALIAEARSQLSTWQNQLALHRALRASGRESDLDTQKLRIEIGNARRKLRTALQAQPRPVRHSGAVTSLRRALDQAHDAARELS